MTRADLWDSVSLPTEWEGHSYYLVTPQLVSEIVHLWEEFVLECWDLGKHTICTEEEYLAQGPQQSEVQARMTPRVRVDRPRHVTSLHTAPGGWSEARTLRKHQRHCAPMAPDIHRSCHCHLCRSHDFWAAGGCKEKMSGCYPVICCGCCGPEEQGTPRLREWLDWWEGKLRHMHRPDTRVGWRSFLSWLPWAQNGVGGGGVPTNHGPNRQSLKAPTSCWCSGASPLCRATETEVRYPRACLGPGKAAEGASSPQTTLINLWSLARGPPHSAPAKLIMKRLAHGPRWC